MADRRPNDDIAELENAFHKLAESKKGRHAQKRQQQRSKALILCLIFAAVMLLIAGIFLGQHLWKNRKISANVTIAGVNVMDMSRPDAIKAVSASFNELYGSTAMTVLVDGHSVSIPSSISGIKLDAEAAVDAALSYSQGADAAQALDIANYISVNKDAIMQTMSTLSQQFDSTLVQPAVQLTGTAPESYDAIDENATLQLEITVGTPGTYLNLEELYTKVMTAYSSGSFKVSHTIPVVNPEEIDLPTVYAQYCVDPVNAELDMETFEAIGGTYGYSFSMEEAATALSEASFGEKITLSFYWAPPEVTVEQATEMLFRDTLASYTTKSSSNADRNTNLRLGCEGINGLILYPGDTFSFNGVLGERTAEKGYRPGTSYVNGKTVLDYGGGICQVATTIYYCAVVADLEIVERWAHGYASSYTPLSTDATVFYNSLDFKFKNNTEYPIRIEASASYGNVSVKLIGTDTKDYYVKFVGEWLETIPYEEVYKEYPVDNEEGYTDGQVLTSAYTGYKSRSWQYKYDKETNELIEKVLVNEDTYAKRDRVICQIVGDEDPTDPSDPSQPPTDPPETDPPETDPPETDPPETDPPETDPPVTDPPVTDPPVTDPPVTDPPADSGSEG